MKNSTQQYLYSVLRQAWRELGVLGQKSTQVLMRTPLPRLLMLCIGIALVITIVPLVISLFVIFMLVKLFLLLVVMSVRKSNYASQKSEWSYKENEEPQLIRVEQVVYRRKDQ